MDRICGWYQLQQQSQLNSAVVVVVEGLGTSLVGAYGSSTAHTPTLDRLSASGVLLDQCFVDSQQLPLQLRSLWTGRHALQTDSDAWSIWRGGQHPAGNARLARLLTDCPQVAQLAEEYGCQAVTLVEPKPVERATDDPAQCAVMELFATAAQELATGAPGLVWIHSRGLSLPWDVPVALRAQFADPDDPLPPATVEVPEIEVTAQTDPDQIIGWGQVAAAQASVIDDALSALFDTIAARMDAAEWSKVVIGLGGVPLGEHGRLGWGKPQLHGEELHATAILAPAQQLPIGMRRPELFQLPDIAATLAALLAIDPPSDGWGRSVLELGAAESPARWPNHLRLALISTACETWIRSPGWSARWAIEPVASDLEQLYVKPDDRWEVAQIANRRRDILERHRELAQQFLIATQQDNRDLLPAIEDDLTNLLR